jgi:uroporphyrinogen III methyltransferase / synthase
MKHIPPLSGIRIINTRAQAQAADLSALLRKKGAVVLELPTIEIKPAGPGSAIDKKLAAVEKFDWVIFTSANSVDVFFKRLIALHKNAGILKNIKIGSIGPGTTRSLTKFRIVPTLTAKDSVGEGLVGALKKIGGWKKKKVLIPRAEKARDIVPDTLAKWGAEVTIVPVYKTVVPEKVGKRVLGAVIQNRYDLITFTSSSTFENLLSLTGQRGLSAAGGSIKAASIGPATSATIRKSGIEPLIEAKEHSVQGLVDAIELYFRNSCLNTPLTE